jgi:hypothetical protein
MGCETSAEDRDAFWCGLFRLSSFFRLRFQSHPRAGAAETETAEKNFSKSPVSFYNPRECVYCPMTGRAEAENFSARY